VLSLRAGRGPAWITVALPDGRRRAIARAATDLVRPPPADNRQPLVSVRTLLPLAHLIRDLLRISNEEIRHGSCRASFDPSASPPAPDAGDVGLIRRAAAVAGAAAGDAPPARP
jgi:hypothetical protein